MNAPFAPAISVILPTRNRAQILAGALERLAAQETGGAFTYEVLIVDNGSTDATRQVVEAWQARFSVPLRYLYEGRTGRSWAMKTGMAAAHGSIFAFTDDDILVGSQWLAALYRCFEDTRADAVAGRVLPRWTAPRPAWLHDDAVRLLGLGCVDHGPTRQCGEGQDCRWVGGNMAVRRHVFDRVGTFDTLLLRDEDTEFYHRCRRAGLRILYEPAAVVSHQIGADRLTLDYFRRWHHRAGYYRAYLIPWKAHHLVTIMPLWYYRRAFRRIARWMVQVVTRRPWWDRFFSELQVREEATLWTHRVELLLRRWVSLMTGRPALSDAESTNGNR